MAKAHTRFPAPVQFLPIVNRELRVAARQSKTWWRRLLTLLIALAIFAFVWATASTWATLSRIGQTTFQVLAVVGAVYALMGGPLATADCLSRERREGTLGLLFLTDLRSYDVVLGKMAASSLDIFLVLLGALPLLTIPLLVGGITPGHIAYVALALANLMLLSLAIGAFASSLLTSGRAALGLTFLIVLFLTLGMPFIWDQFVNITPGMFRSNHFAVFCPVWRLIVSIVPAGIVSAVTQYWISMATVQALAWVFAIFACLRTAKYWRDAPDSKVRLRLRAWLERWRKRNPAKLLAWRRACLASNPVTWIEARDRFQERVLALLVCGLALFFAVKHARSPRTWPTNDEFILWPVFTHYLLCIWICIQAPRRFADDKQSGALELLLCTTLPVTNIIKGTLAALWWRFGRALIALVLLHAFLVQAYVSEHGGWSNSPGKELFLLCVLATIVFPVQGFTLAYVGLYQGLAKGNSLRATFTLIWTLGLLPWVAFIGLVMFCEFLPRLAGVRVRLSEEFAFISWAGIHLTIFAAFLIYASLQLQVHFRRLAAGSPLPWWKRAANALLRGL